MNDRFTEDLKESLGAQALRVPYRSDLGSAAMVRARRIRRRRRVVGTAALTAVVAIAVPVGLQVGDAFSRSDGQFAPATTGPGPVDPPERRFTGPTVIDIDLGALQAGEPPLVPYIDGRTVVVGDLRYGVAGDGDISAAAAFDGGAHVYLSNGNTAEIVRVTPSGTMDGLGYAAATPIASPDLRWNAYATGQVDRNGNVETGVNLWLYDSADGSMSTVRLPAANGVRMVALIDGTVYYRAEHPDGSRQPMSSWTPGQGSPTIVAGSYQATALSPDGQRVAAVTKLTDFGSCSQVVDRSSGSPLWDTCDYTVLGFSPQGEFAWAGPAYMDGYAIGDLAILDGRTGELIRRLPSMDNEVSFMDATFEDGDHLLIRAEQAGQTALVRCSVSSGECVTATPPVDGTADTGSSRYGLTGI